MKLFDYKLILLITLTFVIYFMYRELQSLNQRIDKVEKNVEELPKKQIQYNPEPQFINFEQPSNIVNNMINHVEESNIISPHIQKSIVHTIETNDLDNVLPNDSCTISTEDEDSEELQQMNENNRLDEGDAVEIYSNDNIEDVSSQKTSSIDEDDIIINEAVDIGQHVINQVIDAINGGDDEFLTSSISIEDIEPFNNNSPELVEEDVKITSPNNNLEEIKAEQHISDDNEEPKIEVNVDNLIKQKN